MKKTYFSFLGLIIILLLAGASHAQNIVTVAGVGVDTNGNGDGGLATMAQLNPGGMAADDAGNIYFTDARSHLRKITKATGIVSTIATLATAPNDVALDKAGNCYVVSKAGEKVYKVTQAGVITVFAGSGSLGFGGDGGAATAATLFFPSYIAVDTADNVLISDVGNARIRMVSAATGKISTIAGTGTLASLGDGALAITASLFPGGLGVDKRTNDIYVFDGGSNTVRKIPATTGVISTVVGNGGSGYNGDNIPATSASLNAGWGVRLSKTGDIYISETNSNRIRKVTKTTGLISTIAGTGPAGYSGDSILATTAQLNGPKGIVLVGDTAIYIADNNRIRKVSLFPCSAVTAGGITNTISAACYNANDTLRLQGFNADNGVTYQWVSSTNGTTWTNVGTNSVQYANNITGTTYYQVTATCSFSSLTAQSKKDTITITPAIATAIGISSSEHDTLCVGTPITFTAIPTGGGTAPTYRWMKNGNPVGTASTYTNSTPSNNDIIICILTSNAVCALPAIDTSNKVRLTVNPMVMPTIHVTANPGDTVCAGVPVTLDAVTTSGGAAPVFQWKKNGTAVGNNSSYNNATPVDKDTLICTFTSNDACAIVNTIKDTVVLSIVPLPTPVIAANGAILTTGIYTGYQWYRNDTLIDGANNRTYIATQNANYKVTVTDDIDCVGTSAGDTVNLNPTGIATIAGNNNVSIYPNPATNVINIKAPVAVAVSITAIDGKVVLQQKDVKTLNISDLPNGVYLISVYSEDKNIFKIEKLVKQ